MFKVCVIGVVGVASAVACGQAEQGPAAGEPPALAGPKVTESKKAATLVERDAAGKVKRLDLSPPEAALRLLELDQATKEKTDRIVLERAVAMDRIVRENLLLLVNLSNASQSGDKDEARTLVRELAGTSESLRRRGKLEDELVGALPAEQGEKLKALVREYWEAVMAERRAASDDEMKGDGRERRSPRGRARQGGGGPLAEEYFAVIGKELKRSYERVVTASVQELDDLIKRLDLAPEQEAEVRRLAQDHFQKTAGTPTPAQKGELIGRIYKVLNEAQRGKLLKELRPATPPR